LADTKIGKVSHFFDKIGVAVVELSGSLKVGDKIKFKRHDGEEFEQAVQSMQIEHEQVKQAKKGQAIGLKTAQPVHEGAEVFKAAK